MTTATTLDSRQALASIVDTTPDLHQWGYKYRPGDMAIRQVIEANTKFDEYRRQIKNPDERDLIAFEKAREWLRRQRKTVAVRIDGSSTYGLKHMAGADMGVYIPGGIFIAACIAEEFIIKKYPPNAFINIGKVVRP